MSQQPNIQARVVKSSEKESFFIDMIDKKARYQASKDMMEPYHKNRKKGDKRITAYTHDLFHAVIRSVIGTMADIKKYQRALYDECRAKGQYFCFTTTPSLQTMLNNTKNHASLTPKDKTVYNQIKLLEAIGIVTEKVNYVQTGKRNPFPCKKSPKGRGKFQLWIKQVLCMKLKYQGSAASDDASFFEDIEKSLQQIGTSTLPYRDKELKSITNTPSSVDTAAQHVQAYRKTKIQSFEKNPAYLVAKNQTRMLKNFAARLPNVERSAVEIVAHAIIKQEKHTKKKGYALWYPVNYLSSTAAQKAFGYSVDDWDMIQANYFDKKSSSKAYFDQVQWINSHYSKMLELLQSDGAQRVYELTNQAYWKWYKGIKRDPNLNETKRQELTNLFIQKFKPLLNDEHLQRQ